MDQFQHITQSQTDGLWVLYTSQKSTYYHMFHSALAIWYISLITFHKSFVYILCAQYIRFAYAIGILNNFLLICMCHRSLVGMLYALQTICIYVTCLRDFFLRGPTFIGTCVICSLLLFRMCTYSGLPPIHVIQFAYFMFHGNFFYDCVQYACLYVTCSHFRDDFLMCHRL